MTNILTKDMKPTSEINKKSFNIYKYVNNDVMLFDLY